MGKLGHWFGAQSISVQLLVGGCCAAVLWLAWAIVGIRFAYWAWTGEWLPWRALAEPGTAISRLGQIGDLFGGVNALFAAFAFVGVAIAAYYQHKTFVLQSEQSTRQAFEPLFFKLVDRHEPPQTLDVITLNSSAPVSTAPGQDLKFDDAMQQYRKLLLKVVKRARGDTPDLAQKVRWESFDEQYAAFYLRNDVVLAPYFRKLYHIFKFIAESGLAPAEKVRYANIARASLNKNEVLLLLLNGNFSEGKDFRPLIEGFGLLKHAASKGDEDQTFDQELAHALYCESASLGSSGREHYWHTHSAERPTWMGPGVPIVLPAVGTCAKQTWWRRWV
jgi:Putative phage abortive infection protein